MRRIRFCCSQWSATSLGLLVLLLGLSACGGSNGSRPAPIPNSTVDPVTNPGTDGNDTPGEAAPLPPLPSPPLSEAPGADDEPTPVNRPVTAITRYFLVEDPARRIEPESTLGLTDADFEAGIPDPIISVPAGIDPSVNTPPYFAGLTNQEVFAGQTLRVLYQPVDDEGTDVGMFPN